MNDELAELVVRELLSRNLSYDELVELKKIVEAMKEEFEEEVIEDECVKLMKSYGIDKIKLKKGEY